MLNRRSCFQVVVSIRANAVMSKARPFGQLVSVASTCWQAALPTEPKDPVVDNHSDGDRGQRFAVT